MAAIEFPPITIMFADGTTATAEIWPADLYRLEEHTDVSLTGLGSNISFRQLLPLAWFALRRSQQIPTECTLEVFIDTVKGFDMSGDESAPKDTDPTLSTG